MSIVLFIILESLNVLILYFKPDFNQGNGVAVFNAWEDSKRDESEHLFAEYMTYWVAGTKLIFIVLLVVVLLTGTEATRLYAVVAMILSIATYFWRLHPIIKKMDGLGKITPKGYSKTLGQMISGFMSMFVIALALHFTL